MEELKEDMNRSNEDLERILKEDKLHLQNPFQTSFSELQAGLSRVQE